MSRKYYVLQCDLQKSFFGEMTSKHILYEYLFYIFLTLFLNQKRVIFNATHLHFISEILYERFLTIIRHYK